MLTFVPVALLVVAQTVRTEETAVLFRYSSAPTIPTCCSLCIGWRRVVREDPPVSMVAEGEVAKAVLEAKA
jgi:hypothetical protein